MALFTDLEYVGIADPECWKRGIFELADIKQNYDARRIVTDEIIKSIDENFGTIISGKSYCGKSTILRRLTYEMSRRGYSIITMKDSSFDSDNLVELIKSLPKANVPGKILIVSDNVRKPAKQEIFKVFNHYSRLRTVNLKFVMAGDLSKIEKIKALLDHDQIAEMDYGLSLLNRIDIDFSLNDAELIIKKTQELSLLPSWIDAKDLATKYFKISRENPLIFFDILRWTLTGGHKDYERPVLSNDFRTKYVLLEKNQELTKPAIYCTFLSTFGIFITPNLLQDCGVHLHHLMNLRDEDVLSHNGVFMMHEAWAIEFLLYLYKQQCGSNFESFDAKYKVREMVTCLFNILSVDSLIIIVQRSAELLEVEQYRGLVSQLAEQFFIPKHLEGDEKVRLYTFGFAKFYYLQKDYIRAISYYDKALQIDPHYVHALNNKGTSYYDLGDYQAAILCYEFGLRTKPDDRNLLYNLGQALEALDRNEEAIECYDKVTTSNEYDGFAWLNKGNACHNLKEYDKAQMCYDKAMNVDRNNIQAVAYTNLNKGSMLYEAKRYDDAILLYDRGLELLPNDPTALYNKSRVLSDIGKFDQALQCLDKALSVDPNNYLAREQKAIILTEMGKHEDALKLFDSAIQIKGADVQLLNNKSQTLVKLQRYNDALQLLDKALEINNYYVTALVNKGSILDILHNYHEAIEHYEKAITIDPSCVHAFLRKGETHYHLQEYREAIKNFDKALELDPTNGNCWCNRGLAEINEGNLIEAVNSFDKAIEIDPDHVVALTHKGLILSNSGDYDAAIALFDKSLEINTEYVYAWINKGKTYSFRKEYDKAIECYYKATSINPNPSKKEIWHELGITYYNIGKYDRAIECFNEAIKLDPNIALFWYNKGYALAKSGVKEESDYCFDKAIKLDQNLG